MLESDHWITRLSLRPPISRTPSFQNSGETRRGRARVCRRRHGPASRPSTSLTAEKRKTWMPATSAEESPRIAVPGSHLKVSPGMTARGIPGRRFAPPGMTLKMAGVCCGAAMIIHLPANGQWPFARLLTKRCGEVRNALGNGALRAFPMVK